MRSEVAISLFKHEIIVFHFVSFAMTSQ